MSAQNPAKPQRRAEFRRHNARFRSENATRGQMSDEDLAKPQREWISEPANARRRRENDSTMGTSDRVKRSEVAFSAPPRGPRTRSAPQENPPRAKNAPRHGARKRIEHFSFRHQNFSQTFRKLFEATSCPRKTPRPKRNNRRNEAFRDFGPRPENGQPRETTEREELIRSPNSQKNVFWFQCVRWTWPKKGPKRNFSATFRTSKKSDKTPIFVAFRKFFKLPGSLSALRGLLISSLGVRNGAPYHPTRIYIYMHDGRLLAGPRFFKKRDGLGSI